MDNDVEVSISRMFESARAVADGRMSLGNYLDGLNHDDNVLDTTLDDLRHFLDEELPIPVAVTGAEDADRRQSAIIPTPGEAGQKRKRKKSVSWTEDDHKIFLLGLRFFATLAKKWKSKKWEIISTYFLPNKNTSELASHAQKYFKRQQQKGETQRKSINDTILQKEDEVRLKQLIWENLRARKQSQLSQRGAAPTVVQSNAGQFRQVPGASFPAEQEHQQHHLHQMPGMGVPAVPRLSFSVCAQTHQMQSTPPVTWNMAPNTPNCTSSRGTLQIHQSTSHPAPASGLSCANTRPHTQSITQESQPSPTAQPMVQHHLNQMLVMAAPAFSRPSFDVGGGHTQRQPLAPHTPNAYPREELFRSARGPAVAHPALVPPAPIQELTQSIRPEFQPVPPLQPMVRPAIPHPALQFEGPAPLFRSIGGPTITHPALVPPATIQELTQSIRPEFQPAPTVHPMAQRHLNEMLVVAAPADTRPSFDVCGQTQMQPMPPNTPNAYLQEELSRSVAGPAAPHPGLVPPASTQGLTQSIRPEFQPVPTVQPMVRPHLLDSVPKH